MLYLGWLLLLNQQMILSIEYFKQTELKFTTTTKITSEYLAYLKIMLFGENKSLFGLNTDLSCFSILLL